MDQPNHVTNTTMTLPKTTITTNEYANELLYGIQSSNWLSSIYMKRHATIQRETKETSIDIMVQLDDGGTSQSHSSMTAEFEMEEEENQQQHNEATIIIHTGIQMLDVFFYGIHEICHYLIIDSLYR
jgi:hypothetical protein